MGTNTVLTVSLLTWFGLFAYLWHIDRKLKGPKGQ
jgi:hypothetical protein